jgi:hypothetical protein
MSTITITGIVHAGDGIETTGIGIEMEIGTAGGTVARVIETGDGREATKAKDEASLLLKEGAFASQCSVSFTTTTTTSANPASLTTAPTSPRTREGRHAGRSRVRP